MVPVCLALQQYHVLLAVLGGAVTYVAMWLALGGLRHTRLWQDGAAAVGHRVGCAAPESRAAADDTRDVDATGGRR